MKPLTLRLRHSVRQRIDMSVFTPQRLAGKPLREIEQIPLWQGNRQVPAGDLFCVSGDDSSNILIQSDSDRLDHIGDALSDGRIRVEGRAGAYLGRSMRGGFLHLQGDAGIFAGSGMSGGRIDIDGDAGDFLGAGIAGERRGMSGGEIRVLGNAGDRVGDQMRRGAILIRGAAGDYCASRMVAGTILVMGRIGAQAGLAMRRGSLLLTSQPASIPVTFNDNGVHDLDFLPLLTRSLLDDRTFPELGACGSRVRRWLGDLACDGRGEILVWR